MERSDRCARDQMFTYRRGRLTPGVEIGRLKEVRPGGVAEWDWCQASSINLIYEDSAPGSGKHSQWRPFAGGKWMGFAGWLQTRSVRSCEWTGIMMTAATG